MTDYYGDCMVCGRLIPRRGGDISEVCSRVCADQLDLERELAAAASRPKRGRPRSAQTTVDEMLTASPGASDS